MLRLDAITQNKVTIDRYIFDKSPSNPVTDWLTCRWTAWLEAPSDSLTVLCLCFTPRWLHFWPPCLTAGWLYDRYSCPTTDLRNGWTTDWLIGLLTEAGGWLTCWTLSKSISRAAVPSVENWAQLAKGILITCRSYRYMFPLDVSISCLPSECWLHSSTGANLLAGPTDESVRLLCFVPTRQSSESTGMKDR